MRTPGAPPGLVMLEDRRCRGRMLDNPLRRWLAPSERDVDRLDPPPGATVADLGTGVGFHVPELLRRVGTGGHLYLIDPDAQNLATAEARAPGDPRVRAWVGAADRLPTVPDDSVDRVLLSLVLCCLANKEGTMDEVWRILRPGGRVFASYPRRGARLRRNVRPLRVVPGVWAALVAKHPWTEVPVASGWWIAAHLLEKPPGAPP